MAAPNYALLDKIIGYFAPSTGLRRALARGAIARVRAYEGASTRDGWIPRRAGASINADAAIDGRMLRARARSLCQNNPYMAKALRSLAANIVGEGIRAASRAKRPAMRARIDALWAQWVSVADADGRADFYGLQSMALRAMKQDGEVLIRIRTRRPEDGLPVPLQLQLLEIDYLDTTKTQNLGNGFSVTQGIEHNPIGQVTAYWLFDQHPGDAAYSATLSTWQSRRIPADQIIHLYELERPGQQRGITAFAPVIARARDLAIFEDAEIARKQNEALLSVFVSGDGQDFSIPVPGGSMAAAQERAAAVGQLGTLTGGAIIGTNGQTVTVAQPAAVPGYADYVRVQLYALAAGLGVTYEMLTGDLSQVNFSSSRMGAIEFRRQAAQTQWHVMVPRFCQPVWDAFIAAAELSGALDKPDAACEWTTPRWDYVNPLQDVQADTAAISTGLCSLSEKLRERGYEPEQVFAEMGRDYQALQSTGALDLMRVLMQKGAAPTDAPAPQNP